MGLSLSKHSLEGMIVGETKQLHTAFSPAEAQNKAVLWSTSDDAVVSIDQTGLLKAVGMGEAKVYVVSEADQSLRDSCAVSVSGSSGIKIYDHLLDDEVDPDVVFIRNTTGSRDYRLFVSVHNSYDTSVSVKSSDPEVADVVTGEIDGQQGFTVVPGQKLGTTKISVQSLANEDVSASFNVTLETVSVTGIQLSLSEDGSNPSSALTDAITVSHEKDIRVVFSTSKPGVETPENTKVTLVSSNTSVATVDAEGTFDQATQTVSFKVRMVDNPSNAPAGQSVITATADDGGFTATLTVTAKCPVVESIVLTATESDPIHAGDSYTIGYRLSPEDAYVQDVVWSSADENVATVDGNGVVTVKEDFVFDAANASATEIMIRVTSVGNPSAYAECRIKPYQYVEATGVMVTDQWGNRMRGTSSTTSKVTSGDASTNNACIQYCAGSGSNKKDLFNALKEWAVASPAVEGVDKVGCIPVYLTATPYPYTYPTIADPDQPFYWACYSNSRFSIAGEGYEDGSTATGWPGYSKDDGKSRLFLGHTCKFFTGHSSSGADATYVRVYKYKPGQANSSSQSKTVLLRFTVHTTYKDNSSYGNLLSNIKNEDGTAKVFAPINVDGIPNPFNDPCPAHWTGPMPVPGTYWPLNEDGTPTGETKTWGDIPVPSAITEY
ncbi:MAG: Ig-like domain-containing protein [Candidatus Cryptobacteroides sp.]